MGRPKESLNKKTIDIKNILDKVVDWDVIANSLYDLATGYKAKNPTNGSIYDKPPNPDAIKLLLEYRFGKPAQPISNDEEKPFEIIIGNKDQD